MGELLGLVGLEVGDEDVGILVGLMVGSILYEL